ncbi:MAG: LysE family transporter [Candidatus Magasanikiibacteriota bacterium]
MKVLMQIIEVFLLGLIGGAVPGPILAAVFTEILQGGFKKSWKIIFWALLAETFVGVVIVLFIYTLNIPEFYFQLISIGGGLFLLWLASKVWKINEISQKSGEVFGLSKIFLLTLLNGGFWIYWITVCTPRAFALNAEMAGGLWVFVFFMELGWLTTTATLGYVFSCFRSILLKKNLVSIVFKGFALILIFFALESLLKSLLFFIL